MFCRRSVLHFVLVATCQPAVPYFSRKTGKNSDAARWFKLFLVSEMTHRLSGKIDVVDLFTRCSPAVIFLT